MTVIAGEEQRSAGCRLSGIAEGLDPGIRLGDLTEGRAHRRASRVTRSATFTIRTSGSLTAGPDSDVLAQDAFALTH